MSIEIEVLRPTTFTLTIPPLNSSSTKSEWRHLSTARHRQGAYRPPCLNVPTERVASRLGADRPSERSSNATVRRRWRRGTDRSRHVYFLSPEAAEIALGAPATITRRRYHSLQPQVNRHLRVLMLQMDCIAIEHAEASPFAAATFDHLCRLGIG